VLPGSRAARGFVYFDNHQKSRSTQRWAAARQSLNKKTSRAGRNSGWPLYSLPTHREVVAAALRISALGAPHSKKPPGSRAFRAACLHSTPPRHPNQSIAARGLHRIFIHARAKIDNAQAECLVRNATGNAPTMSLAFMTRLSDRLLPCNTSE
jgi:hypothetical protein